MAEWPCCHDPLRFSPVSLRFVPPPFSSPRFRNRGSFGTARANFTKAKPLKPSKEPTIIIDARCCHSTSADANSPRRNFRGQNKISYVPWSKPTIKNQGIFKTGEAREPPVKSRHFQKQRLSASKFSNCIIPWPKRNIVRALVKANGLKPERHGSLR